LTKLQQITTAYFLAHSVSFNFYLSCEFYKLQPCLIRICGSISGGIIFTHFKPLMYYTNFMKNQVPVCVGQPCS